LEIRYFNRLDSTQKYLLSLLTKNDGVDEVAVISNCQSAGVGSRGNSWIGRCGNFFSSVAIKRTGVPLDLPTISASIYFGFLMVKSLREYGSKVWLKWPNDIYIENYKVGGVITNLKRDHFIVGIGVNLQNVEDLYRGIDVSIEARQLLETFLTNIKKDISWKDIFQEYSLEFDRSRDFVVHTDDGYLSLRYSELLSDGSLMIDGRRVVTVR
jgi:BirA family biotin operon repressor/biotin-[acetyl-CoA-carboxylase] ligase